MIPIKARREDLNICCFVLQTGEIVMFAFEIMTAPGPTIDVDSSIIDAIDLIIENDMNGIAVVDENQKLVGIITAGDLLRRVEIDTCGSEHSNWLSRFLCIDHAAADYVRSHSRCVRDLMTTNVISASADTPLDRIAELMQTHRVKQVPVIRDGKVVGMLTRTNFTRQLQKELKREIFDPGSDAQILQRLNAELLKQDWYPRDSITLSVHDGIVTFEGSILDDRIRTALRVAAENIVGVTSVEDRLLWLSATAAAAADAPFSG